MIERLALSFDPTQDRLLLTIVSRGTGESRGITKIWLTRRLCRTWADQMQTMRKLAASEPRTSFQSQPQPMPSRQERAGKPRQAEPTKPSPTSPEGDSAPELATKIACSRRRTDGRWVMRFEAEARRVCSLELSDEGLRDIEAALHQQVRRAQWSLDAPSPARIARPDGRALH